jgi:hypothetical protein
MKRLLPFTMSMICSISLLQAQTTTIGCISDQVNREVFQNSKEARDAQEKLEKYTAEYIAKYRKTASYSGRAADSILIVPVVFHILHDGGTTNLTDADIINEVVHMNEYYSKSNPELPSTKSDYTNLVGDVGIEFRLAGKDPDGNCTNGIIRHYTQATYNASDNNKLTPWPRDQYLNIWVAQTLKGNQGVLAFSRYPSSVINYVNGQIIDGILTKNTEVNTTGRSRSTLAHEAGHWLNLKHVWGDNNDAGQTCGSDDVDDTPETKGNLGGCNLNRAICNPPVIESEQNIMNYSDCPVYFTEGQKLRMRAALSAPISGRNNLWTPANLAATGTDVLPSSDCAVPIADFGANKKFVCQGSPIIFSDYSFNAAVTNRTWTFPFDADVITSNAASQSVLFSSPGWKEVTLTVENTNGSSTKTKSMVYVSDPTNEYNAPFFESFEDFSSSKNDWLSFNNDNNSTKFERFETVGLNSDKSVKLNNYDSRYEGDIDDLVSPTLNLSTLASADFKMSFRYSFATFNQQQVVDPEVDSLVLQISNNCGNTWRTVYSNGGFGLFNAGYVIGSYTPGANESFWKPVSINLASTLGGLTSTYLKPGIRFRWRVTSGNLSNNFYLDNVNIGNAADPTGVNDLVNQQLALDAYPNPTTSQLTVGFSLQNASSISIFIEDMTGKIATEIQNQELPAGAQTINLDTEKLAKGVYLLRLETNTSIASKKITKF